MRVKANAYLVLLTLVVFGVQPPTALASHGLIVTCSGAANPTDTSGNNLNLTVAGSPAARQSPEDKYGYGYDFDDLDDALYSDSPSLEVSGSFSAFIAFETDDTASLQGLIDSDRRTGGPGAERYMLVSTQANDSYRYVHEDNAGGAHELFSNNTVAAGFHSLTVTRNVSTNRVIVKIDGFERINATYATDPVGAADERFSIGAFWSRAAGAHTGFLDGGVYEVRVWQNLTIDQSVLDRIADPADASFAGEGEGSETALWLMDDCTHDPPPPSECTTEQIEGDFQAQSATPSGGAVRLVVPGFIQASESVTIWARTMLDGNATTPNAHPVLEIGRVDESSFTWNLVTALNMSNAVNHTVSVNGSLYYANWTVPAYADGVLLHFEVCADVDGTIRRAQESREVNSQQGQAGPQGPVGPAGPEGPPTTVDHVYLTTPGSGQYVVPSDVSRIMVECVGGAGGGGGSQQSALGRGAGGGGGAGAYVRATFDGVSGLTFNWTVGTGGAGGAAGNNPGTAGTASQWVNATTNATILDCGAGSGGAGSSASTISSTSLGGIGGSASGGDVQSRGTNGEAGHTLAGDTHVSGRGGASYFGDGGSARSGTTAGQAGLGPGAGGSGGASSPSSSNQPGGDGSNGAIIIWEFGETITLTGPQGPQGDPGESGDFNNTVFGLLSAFPGMTVDESTALVLWLFVLFFAYHQRLLFLGIAGLIGALDHLMDVFAVNGGVIGFVGTLMLLVLAIMLEALRDIRNEALEAHKHKEQDGV